jgi:hypothetical protein
MVPLPELQPKRCGLFSTPQIQCMPAFAGSLVLRRLVLESVSNFPQNILQGVYARDKNCPVRVSTLMRSPSLMYSGT